MKKLVIMIICLIFLTACIKKQKSDLYEKLIKELNKINESSENIPLDLDIEIEKFDNSLFRYSALINKKDETMKDVVALVIHNKESENVFPSIGIFDDKVTINEKKGIKLTGYVESIDDIEFKLLISYINKEDDEVKYYYIEDISTINVN